MMTPQKINVCRYIAMTVIGICVSCSMSGKSDTDTLHDKLFVMDSHSDTLDKSSDFGAYTPGTHMDLNRLQQGGVDCVVFACWIKPHIGRENYVSRMMEMLDNFYTQCDRYPDRMELARTAADIRRITRAGKLAAVLSIESGHAIVNSLEVLRMYWRLGIRSITLTWMNSNEWADSSSPVQTSYIPYGAPEVPHGGLTDFGRQVVREMNRLGMVIDVSHASDETFWDTIDETTKPIIASHSCCWALNDHYRNMKDDQLRATAENGGVISINFVARYVSRRYHLELERAAEILRNSPDLFLNRDPAMPHREKILEILKDVNPVQLSDVIDQIEHVIHVAGIDHVGLGSDFDGVNYLPEQLQDATDYPLITQALLERGYTQEEIAKIMGENLLRVFKENIGS